MGTVLVKNLAPGALASDPQHLVAFAEGVLFSATDSTTLANGAAQGRELYRSNGTAAGTTLVKDINETLESSSNPEGLTMFNGSVYFAASGTVQGPEPWRSRGTATTTELLADLTLSHPKSAGSLPLEFTPVETILFFSANDGRHGRELYATRPDAVPLLVRDINTTPVPGFLATASAEVADLTALGGILYFGADDGSHGRELWRSDGTAAGTLLVHDVSPGAAGSTPIQLTAVAKRLFFVADDGVSGAELWCSDGTAAGTRLVKDIRPGPAGSNPRQLTAVGEWLMFNADDGSGGRELWRSDGTEAGTHLVHDIHSGVGDSDPTDLVAIGESLYFSADDGRHGRELWRSDGTAQGTTLVADLHPNGSSAPADFTLLGSAVLFSADDGSHGRELWTLDASADLPKFAITAMTPRQPEGHAGVTAVRFRVERSGLSSGRSRVWWSLAGAGIPAQGSLVFQPGELRRSFSVAVAGNHLQQPDRTLTVTLQTAHGASVEPGASSARAILTNDDWIGGPGDDALHGSSAPDWLNGRGGRDQLTGGAGADVFAFRHGHSPLSAPDRITDFELGHDRLALLQSNGAARARPGRCTRAAVNTAATSYQELAAAVFADADGGRLGLQPLAAGQAALVVATNPAIAGTYVLINNFSPALESQLDLLVEISGSGAVLPAPGLLQVSRLFS